MAELVERSIDLSLGLVDAAVIAIAECLGLRRWQPSNTGTC